MKKHIHIFGASGSGTTTLAKALCDRLGYVHFDSDDYFWLPTDPPFTTRRPPEERVKLLKDDLAKAEKWILSGSNCKWGDFLMDSYDLAVFLFVPPEIRLKRLAVREAMRYGIERISPGGYMHESYKEFMEWNASYDNAGMEMRSLALHNEWMKRLKCPVIRIEGAQSIKERVEIVLREICDGEGQ